MATDENEVHEIFNLHLLFQKTQFHVDKYYKGRCRMFKLEWEMPSHC